MEKSTNNYSQVPGNKPKNKIFDFIKRKPGVSLVIAYLCSGIIFGIITRYLFKIKYLTTPDSVNGFLSSFSASLLEDLVFFFFIGVVLFVITLKKLEDNEIDVRLDTVINSPNVTASAREYFRKETKAVLAFYEKCNVLIRISEHDEKDGAYKIYLSFDAVINNMCKDIQFAVQTNAFVKPGMNINDDLGELTIFSIKDLVSGDHAGERVGIPVKLSKKGYNKTVPLLISDSGKAEYKLGFGIWTKYDQEKELFFTSVDRFTDSYNLTIENGLEDNVSFEFYTNLVSENELYQSESTQLNSLTKLGPKSSIQIMTSNNLKPSDRIQIFFSKPTIENKSKEVEKDNEE